jgi:hypothetical protein
VELVVRRVSPNYYHSQQYTHEIPEKTKIPVIHRDSYGDFVTTLFFYKSR